MNRLQLTFFFLSITIAPQALLASPPPANAVFLVDESYPNAVHPAQETLCVHPNQRLWMLADLLSQDGKRGLWDYDHFTWFLVRGNGQKEEWSAAMKTPSSVFSRQGWQNIVEVTIPTNLEPKATLMVKSELSSISRPVRLASDCSL
jgi:hypothetical protein